MASTTPWRNGDFVRLWGAGTISIFGSLITRTALPFAAILVLGAGPIEVAGLRALELVAGILVGLLAGAWVDRLRRRPIMVATDLGRAVLLGSIPVAAILGVLGLAQLFVVAFLAAVLTTFFNTADRAYLPTIVEKDELVPANAALTASASAAEFSAFGIGGVLVQVLTAPIAIAIDALSFVASAVLILAIRRPEPARPTAGTREPVLAEIRDGLRLVFGDPVLRALTGATAAAHALWGVFGAAWLLFATEIGLGPALIGLIAGIGGLGSLIGSLVAPKVVARLGVGPCVIGGMVLFTIGNALIPLAPAGAVLVATGLLFAQQLVGDSGYTVYAVAEVSIRQARVDDRVMGRVVASAAFVETLVMLAATIGAGVLASVAGLRATMAVGVLGGAAAVVILWFSPLRTMRTVGVAPAPSTALLPGDELPVTE